MRATTTPALAMYVATVASRLYCRPASGDHCVFEQDGTLQLNSFVASNLRVQDPVTNDVFVRLDNCTAWLPLRCLGSYTATTTCTIIKVSTPTNVYRNIHTWANSNALATLPINHLDSTTCHVIASTGSLYARVSYNNHVGWCRLEQSDVLSQCPPRLTELAAGRSIPVAILQGDYYLLVLNEVQAGGTTTQRFKYRIPHTMARQIDNCISKGRHQYQA
ncbi:hypothetical protein SDRG_14118 [Saprolegnia diclina VS20]|uniref:Uncharacterized protein n=1 Tax=Saprolegnia diclina (strain VS20) TaxID=1156394 RepID=T0Q0T2_SAPDV|nr:hypothetical protein SDRG_14118 [Saprolegnia diclina VS20]EQC28161.1 hypothetical protein SDRG_14118 [Saprolegnia diclina VS20]|eukprot:XP_008618447.1 hypothetical protein SDRG_14118 [Saprolegnia diclina VS20]